MMLLASKSRNTRASFAAIAFVGVVACATAWAPARAVAAPAPTEVVSPAPEAATPPCHEAPAEVVVTPSAAAATPASSVEAVSIAPRASGPNPFADRFEGIVLRTHEGKTVRFYEDLLQGKIVLINFMYATCKGR